MRMRAHIAAILCAAALAATALAIQYTWTGNIDSDWDEPDNWKPDNLDAYPASVHDDAMLPASAERYRVDLITVHIDDLEIRADYTFGAVSGSPALTVNSFTINAGDSEDMIEVTITGATIKKTNPE